MVLVLSSAARMPLSLATMAAATRSRSLELMTVSSEIRSGASIPKPMADGRRTRSELLLIRHCI